MPCNGWLVKVDADLVHRMWADRFTRSFLDKGERAQLDALALAGGVPKNPATLAAMPIACACGALQLLRQAMGPPFHLACHVCARVYWPDRPDFAAALRALLRIRWELVYDALLEASGGYLVYPAEPLARPPVEVPPPSDRRE